jgi:hypothetical protein
VISLRKNIFGIFGEKMGMGKPFDRMDGIYIEFWKVRIPVFSIAKRNVFGISIPSGGVNRRHMNVCINSLTL